MNLHKIVLPEVNDIIANAWLVKNFGKFAPEQRSVLLKQADPVIVRRLQEIPENLTEKEQAVFQRAWLENHFGEYSPKTTIGMMMQIPDRRFKQALAEMAELRTMEVKQSKPMDIG